MERLIAEALAAVRRYRMLDPGEAVVVGLSGGPDSVALASLLRGLGSQLRLKLYLAHLHHGLRGKSADLDQALVERLAKQWRLPLSVERADVRGLAKSRRLSLEEAGRQARHEFLERTRLDQGAGRIALAHHADDSIETLLINLLRGAAATGLAGIPPVRGAIIRPLITSTRASILAYLKAHKLPWREDPSNRDLRFLRNRVRHELLPELESFNPGVRKVLFRTTQALAEEEAALAWAADRILGQAELQGSEGLRWERKATLAAPAGLRLVWYRRQLERWQGHLLGLTQAHLLALDALATGEKPQAEVHLPAGIRARRRYDRMELGLARSAALSAPTRPELPLAVPGRVIWPLEAEQSGRFAARYVRPPASFAKMTPSGNLRLCRVWLDPDRLPGPLFVRAFSPGDRIRPLGFSGTRKLKDVFMELRLPRELRRVWPVVAAEAEVVWVPGYRIAREFKLTPASRRALRIEFHWPGQS
jgi:tRNA(Ile)-lysidine synthase